MHYASKTASASRGIPAIRLTLRNPSGFSVPAQFLVLIQNPAGGGSRQFNRFLAELATGQICRSCWKLRCKKTLLTFRMSHGFDFATQNLGSREEFSHLIRKEPAPRKTVAFPKVWQLYRLGFDFGVRMWYSEEEEGSAPGRLRFWLITASRLRPLAVISYSLSLKYERAAITVPATVATHVTNPTTNSAVIRKPPSIQYSD